MVKRDELIDFIREIIGQEWLNIAIEKDEMANGVQIVGGDKVERLVLGVSLNEDFLLEAVKAKAQMCLFHHGFDPRTYKSRLPLYAQKRLSLIFKNRLTVLGFHYCLDAHPKLGNNAVIIRKLGAKLDQPLFDDWGYTARFARAQDVKRLSEKCARLFEHEVFAVLAGPQKVRTIGVCSGGAKPYTEHIAEMEAKGVELFITGETSESVPHKMKESGINFFAGGHYATEVFGVRELGKLVKAHFKDRLAVEFIDIPNPL